MVSIIVPVWNHVADVTVPFIKNIMENTKEAEFELIVVNNGSTDATREFLEKAKKQYKNLKVIHLPENLGFGGGNNEGYKHAKGEYICFISNDVVLENPTWLRTLVEEGVRNPNALYGHQLVTWNQLTLFNNQCTPYITGYLMFGTKALFDSILDDGEVFDTAFGLAYFEDVELSERARLQGYELIEFPNLGIKHLQSKSSDQIDIGAQTKSARKHFTNKMTILHLEKSGRKRIVFYFASSYPFIDSDYEGKGVGGAEASLILLSREFAKLGWQVEIYNTTNISGVFGGVLYRHVQEFRPWDYCDVFVLFREPYNYLPMVNALYKIFWSCDQYTFGNWRKQIFPFVDKVIAISEYHGNYMDMVYGPVKNKLQVVDLGVNAEDYEEEPQKIPGKLIFCSVPRRGLEHMIRLFPEIRKKVPYATLVVTSDYRLWGLSYPDNAEFAQHLKTMPGVSFLGKVSREELVRHQREAEVMTYPCTYEECFCIAAMECIAAGAIPVATSLAALKTTVGDSGTLIPGFPGEKDYDKRFVDSVVELLTDKKLAADVRTRGRARALSNYRWDVLVKKWLHFIEEKWKEVK